MSPSSELRDLQQAAKLAEIREARRKRRKKAASRRVRRFSLAVLIAGTLALFVRVGYRMNWGSYLGNLIPAFSSSGSGARLEQSEVLEIRAMKGSAAVLNPNSVMLYGNRGEVLNRFPFRYARPHTVCRNGKLLIFDLGGAGWQITNKKKVLHEETSGNGILAADLGDKGEAVIARRGTDVLSEVTVYSPRFDPMYIWRSGECYAGVLALNRAGDRLATGGVLDRGGALTSQLVLHDMTGREERVKIELENQLILSLVWTGQDRLQAVTDRSLVLYDAAGTALSSVPLPEPPAALYNSPEGGCLIATGDSFSAGGLTLSSYDRALAPAGETPVSRPILSLSAVGKTVTVLTEGDVYLAGLSLERMEPQARPGVRRIAPFRGGYYAVSGDDLLRVVT